MALDSKILLIFSTIFVSSTVFSTKHSIDSTTTTTTTIPIDFSLIPTSTHSNELPTSAIKPPHRLTKNEKIVKPNSDEKALQAKMKRLKKLRNEVRLLVNQLKVDKRMKDEFIAIQLTPPPELKNGSLAKWKSRIRNRVRSILKRLEKLEKVMKIRKAEIREAKRKLNKSSHPKTTQMLLVPTRVVPTKVSSRRNRRTTTNPVVVHLVKSTIEPTGITMNQMHVAFNQARNKSLSGDLGSQCNSHNECKPGLCCHKMKQRDGNTISECVRHAKKELDYCEHSCACMLGLHCFRETRGIGSILPKPAFCKKASPDDALNGIYENAKDRVFEDTKPF